MSRKKLLWTIMWNRCYSTAAEMFSFGRKCQQLSRKNPKFHWRWLATDSDI